MPFEIAHSKHLGKRYDQKGSSDMFACDPALPYLKSRIRRGICCPKCRMKLRSISAGFFVSLRDGVTI